MGRGVRASQWTRPSPAPCPDAPAPHPLQDLFAAMAKPQHREAVKAVVGVFARDEVGAYLAGPSAQPPPAVATAAAAAQQLRWVGWRAGPGRAVHGRLCVRERRPGAAQSLRIAGGVIHHACVSL